MSSLIWNPVIETINSMVAEGNSITGCISAFSKGEAINVLRDAFDREHCYVLTRWRVPELSSGVSGIDVYPILDKLGIPLYISFRLHSKLYRFTDGRAICGSCNATSSGLGLNQHQNIETASIVQSLDIDDEIAIKKLTDNSLRVTDAIYEEFKSKVEAFPPIDPFQTNELEIYRRHIGSKQFLLSDLPASKTPEALMELLQEKENIAQLSPQAIADCIKFDINPNSHSSSMKRIIASTFCDSPFVKNIVAEIRKNSSMSFGAMTSFVHDHCRDVPLPFRSDVKDRVNTLYNWLSCFFDDISWNVPGAHSQVICSNLRS